MSLGSSLSLLDYELETDQLGCPGLERLATGREIRCRCVESTFPDRTVLTDKIWQPKVHVRTGLKADFSLKARPDIVTPGHLICHHQSTTRCTQHLAAHLLINCTRRDAYEGSTATSPRSVTGAPLPTHKLPCTPPIESPVRRRPADSAVRKPPTRPACCLAVRRRGVFLRELSHF